MKIYNDYNLRDLSTFKIGGKAKYFINIQSKEDIVDTFKFIKDNNFRFYIVGGGSNTIFTDKEFDGVIIKSSIKGFEKLEELEHSVLLKIFAGENWDEVVLKTISMNLSGFEHMSLIPGTVGATPIQNVGAFRQEICETLVELEAYDIENEKFVTIKNSECNFSYRSSIFKTTQKNKYFIYNIIFKLLKNNGYSVRIDEEVKKNLNLKNIVTPTLKDIRDSVIEIRNTKLYDPVIMPNCGSFFENLIITKTKFLLLKDKFPNIVYYDLPNDEVKLATGWLIEQLFPKGTHFGNLMISDKHALTLLNPKSEASFNEVIEVTNTIINKVKNIYDVELELEPHLVY